VESIGTPALWIGFTVVVFAVLGIDLFLASRDDKPMSRRAALGWTTVWVGCALAFAFGIFAMLDHARSREAAMEFLAGYLIEYSLSIDNLFVFLLLFSAFKVPQQYQHRVLFWGIFGAVLLRAIFIFAGTALLQQFHFLIYVFGAFLIFTGIKLVIPGGTDEDDDVSDNKVVVFAKRFIRVHDHYDGHNFFTMHNGVRLATPLFLVLVCVELSDVVFALDSIPAVFGVTLDPFIVYTSNIFAILGLRSLFFLLSGALWGLRFLKPALGLVLTFVGVKMTLGLIANGLERAGLQAVVALLPQITTPHGMEPGVPTPVSLAVVGGLLAFGVGASLLFPGQKKSEQLAAEEIKSDVDEALHPDHRHAHPPLVRHVEQPLGGTRRTDEQA
jgi:tellurite resistance protein TerC